MCVCGGVKPRTCHKLRHTLYWLSLNCTCKNEISKIAFINLMKLMLKMQSSLYSSSIMKSIYGRGQARKSIWLPGGSNLLDKVANLCLSCVCPVSVTHTLISLNKQKPWDFLKNAFHQSLGLHTVKLHIFLLIVHSILYFIRSTELPFQENWLNSSPHRFTTCWNGQSHNTEMTALPGKWFRVEEFITFTYVKQLEEKSCHFAFSSLQVVGVLLCHRGVIEYFP